MKFEAFVWGPRFLTGIAVIDGQHQRLVELINRLGDMLLEDSTVQLPEILDEVAAYAGYHFRSEEAIWAAADLEPEDQACHQESHLEFVAQLRHFQKNVRGSTAEKAHLLHGYLASWLIFHILGEDHGLAREVLAKQTGKPVAVISIPAASPALPNATEEILLGALKNLYAVLTTMNTQLREANNELDTRVRVRTQELESVNEALVQERDLLVQANTRLDETRSRLQVSEKMASIGQLAAGVAHEINNPIGFVNSNLGTLREYLTDTFAMLDTYAAMEPLIARDPQAIATVRAAKETHEIAFVREDARLLLDETSNGLQRVRSIVQDLKTFSHVDQTEWQRIDLRIGLESTLNIVWNELRQKAELRREWTALPEVLCNAGQLNQVFMNLLMNAAQAIDGHGVITVRTGVANGEVWVEIEDDGCGISPEHQRHIFDPFFTTKAVGKGTGLGLSLSWGIVQKHGGRIEVDSMQGRGTRFRVCLPVDGPESKSAKNKEEQST